MVRTRWVAVCAAILLVAVGSQAQRGRGRGGGGAPGGGFPQTQAPSEVGLLLNEAGAFQGYTLLSPLQSRTSYLIDMEGRVVRTWEADATPSSLAYLLPNGHILRAEVADGHGFGGVAGGGGRIQELDWDNQPVWDFTYASENFLPHHDFAYLPNGNVVMIVKEKKSPEEVRAAGRVPSAVGNNDLQIDSLVEFRPNGPDSADIVWEWHLWDHLTQDADSDLANYGRVGERPERMDINFAGTARLTEGSNPPQADWTHFNGVAYNEALDQLVISVHGFNEIWIIDHSTTSEEAAGSEGGQSGRGGDLLFRWGNPAAYRQGEAGDQQLFGQHDPQWIPADYPGGGHMLLFNNGYGRPGDEQYSMVVELELPMSSEGTYDLGSDGRYGPEAPVWSYTAPDRADFFSFNISGTARLPNGNTLICSGAPGIIFEIDSAGEIVWQFNNPGAPAQGGRGGGADGSVFRAYRYPPDFEGLAGRDLEPREPLVDFVSSN